MSKKVKATGMISQLFRKTEHFEMLLSHDTLLQVQGKSGVHVVRTPMWTPIVGVPSLTFRPAMPYSVRQLFSLLVMQTLSRLMREEMKRSIDLCINIVSVYFSISNFTQFHPVIMDNQVRNL